MSQTRRMSQIRSQINLHSGGIDEEQSSVGGKVMPGGVFKPNFEQIRASVDPMKAAIAE